MADNDYSDQPPRPAGDPAEPTTQAWPADADLPPHATSAPAIGSAASGSADSPEQLTTPYALGPGPSYGASQPNPPSPAAGQFGYYPPNPYQAPGYQPYLPPAQPAAASPSKRRRLLPLLAVAVVAALIGGGVGAATVALTDNDDSSVNTGLRITNDTGVPAAKTDGTIGAAADKIRPSVVTINVASGQSEGTGSGVILRADGYILTNDHVVSLAASGGTMQVTLSDGRIGAGTIVGRDTSDDLAVIKVAGLSNLTPAVFGKSGNLTVGQTVVAVGAPLGLSDTVTSGIVSNTARPVRSGDNDQAVFEAVQTDAAINPGNSGGPLVDLNGSVVGINAAIATDSSGGGLQIPGQTQQSGSIGIGFAIPSDEASRIAGELIAGGKAYHAILGVSVSDANSTTTSGVTISGVTAGGAGAAAGLKAGDLVTTVDSTRVTSADALIAAVRSHAPGAQVKVVFLRGGQSQTVTVTLGKSDS